MRVGSDSCLEPPNRRLVYSRKVAHTSQPAGHCMHSVLGYSTVDSSFILSSDSRRRRGIIPRTVSYAGTTGRQDAARGTQDRNRSRAGADGRRRTSRQAWQTGKACWPQATTSAWKAVGGWTCGDLTRAEGAVGEDQRAEGWREEVTEDGREVGGARRRLVRDLPGRWRLGRPGFSTAFQVRLSVDSIVRIPTCH